MGEAKNRGTKEQRVDQAEREAADHKKRISFAVKERKHIDGLQWLIFQTTESVAQRDGKGAFVTDDKGSLIYGPDEDGWKDTMDFDIPDWVKQPEVIGQMRQGERVSADPEKGTKWYRVVLIKPPEQH